jgi:O-succinylhomoserine sulfhydrylase
MGKSKEKDKKDWRLATRLVRGGLTRSDHCETSEALYLNSGYVYDSALEAEQSFDGTLDRFVYSRFANPTVGMFEERLRQIEGAEACRATASGMAAVSAALLCSLRAGQRVVASRALFGSCSWVLNDLMPRFGAQVELVDGTNLAAWERALATPVSLVFLETPSNPTLELIDIKAVAKLTHKAGGLLIVDNVFATPLLQRPMVLGADIVIYSATKHIDGQGRTLGGAILCSKQFMTDHLGPYLRHTGPALSPFNAWVLLKGLETLELRVARHVDNALRVAKFLEGHDKIARVIYPGLPSHPQYKLGKKQMSGGGTIIAFEPKGGKKSAFKLLDKLQLIDISNNLGDAKSLITHPWTTTHASRPAEEKLAMGITEGLIRLSVGLEDAEDVIQDLAQAV